MSFRQIHLRKLLRIMYAHPSARTAAIRSDIREEIARERGELGGGADFYGPFWADAKSHAVGEQDLRDSVRARIEANAARANLYPRLRDGFLLWWDYKRRWTNEPFLPLDAPKGRYRTPEFGGMVKVENFLSVRDGLGDGHFVYPYFSHDPSLSNEAARVGLWVIGRAIPQLNWDEIRLLDVIRGEIFSADRTPLQGDEEEIFRNRYRAILRQWDKLREQY